MTVETLLQKCTVKLSIPGQRGWGTGFFVAPGLILTCAHVVKSLVPPNRVHVQWQQEVNFAEAALVQHIPQLDLALLQLTSREANLPCVYLDEELQVGQDLYFFGYPDEDFEYGCPVTGSCEGLTGDVSPLIKFKQAQVRPGMSGSALLNRQTQKICGIVKFTRNRASDLGGGAIPSRVILEHFPQLRELQQEFHTGDRRWCDFIGTTSEINWREICRDMLVQRQELKNPRLGSSEKFKLEELYIPLGLVEKQPLQKRSNDVSPELGSHLYRDEKIIPIAHDRFFEEVLKCGDSPNSEGKRIALIGEAGSGKTTLLQKIASWILENGIGYPIWIPLGQVETTLSDYLTKNWLSLVTANITPEIRQDLEQQFAEGRVWLLLDGLDERNNLTDERFIDSIMSGWVTKAKMLITSRLNTWEVVQNALSEFDVYRNLDLEPMQLRQFVHNWFAKTMNTESGEKLLQALDQPNKERIRDLMRNPLRCFLLCSSWQLREGKLPDTKAQLYDDFIETIYEWKSWKPQQFGFTTRSKAKQELNQALGQLARQAIDEERSRFILKHDFVKSKLGELDDPLFSLAMELGWLNIIGKDPQNPLKNIYAFYHPTFQEHFAALVIDDWDFFLPRDHQNQPITGKFYRIFEQQWKEVYLLWLGQTRAENAKNDFLDKLMNFDDGCGDNPSDAEGCEGFYGTTAYFLAAEGIKEHRNFSNASRIVKQLVRWSFGYIDDESNQWMKYIRPFEERAIKILFQMEKETIVLALENLIGSTCKDTVISRKATELLKSIDPKNPSAQDSLVDKLAVKESIEVMCKIYVEEMIEVTVLLPPGLQKSIEYQSYVKVKLKDPRLNLGAYELNGLKKISLENLCNYSQQAHLRLISSISLLEIDFENSVAIRALKDLQRTSKDTYVRKRAGEALSYIESPLSSIKYAKTHILNKRENFRSSTKIYDSRDEYLSKIKSATASDEKVYLAGCLLEIDPNSSASIKELLQNIINPAEGLFQWKAVNELGGINSSNQDATSILETILRDNLLYKINNPRDEEEKIYLAGCLLEIDPNNSTSINILLGIIRDSDQELSRWKAVNESVKIGLGNQEAISFLEQILEDFHLTGQWAEPTIIRPTLNFQQNILVLHRVITNLWRIDPGNHRVVPALEKLYQFSRTCYIDIAKQIGESLEEITSLNSSACIRMEDRKEFSDASSTLRIINILLKYDPRKTIVINTLLRLINRMKSNDITVSTLQNLNVLLTEDQMPKVVTSLKDCLLSIECENNSELFEAHYEVFLNCAQNLSYFKFHRAWHEDSLDS
jgi:energy-coupling factor transporter ATP-binding protein EcfA2